MTSRRRRVLAVAGAVVGIALGLRAAAAWNPGVDPRLVVWDLAVGWSFIGGGLAAWAARPSSAAGRLLVVVGVAWFAGSILARARIPPSRTAVPGPRDVPDGSAGLSGRGRRRLVAALRRRSGVCGKRDALSGDRVIVAAVAVAFLALGATGLMRTAGRCAERGWRRVPRRSRWGWLIRLRRSPGSPGRRCDQSCSRTMRPYGDLRHRTCPSISSPDAGRRVCSRAPSSTSGMPRMREACASGWRARWATRPSWSPTRSTTRPIRSSMSSVSRSHCHRHPPVG